MKAHLRKHGWIYIVCILLVIWPLVLIRMQRVPPVDVDTIYQVGQWIDGEVERQYGAPLYEEFKDYDVRWEDKDIKPQDSRAMRVSLLRGGSAFVSPCIEKDIASLTQIYESQFEEWNDLARRGVYYRPIAKTLDRLESATETESLDYGFSSHLADFMTIQLMTKWRRALAEQAIGRQDWENALQILEENAHIGDPVRTNYLIGHLIAVAVRGIGYGGYRVLLLSNPPPEVDRQALAALIRLRESDPKYDWLIPLMEIRGWMEQLAAMQILPPSLTSRGEDWMKNALIFNAVASAFVYRDQFSDRSFRSWGDRFEKKYLGDDSSFGYFPFVEVMSQGGLRWTTISSTSKWLKQAAETEPVIFESLHLPEESEPSLDPWTLALLSGKPGYNEVEAETRNRVMMTKGRLLELAFAARLYRHERGQWPQSIDSLVPEYLPPFDDPDSTKEVATQPFTPFQIARQDVDDALKEALWSQVLSREITRERNAQKPDEIDVIQVSRELRSKGHPMTHPEWIEQPVIPVALAEGLRAYPKLVESAEVWMARSRALELGPQPGRLPEQSYDLSEWEPIREAYARQVTDESDALFWRQLRDRDLPPDKQGDQRPELTERTVEPPAAIHLRVKLRAPEKVQVIWSPGPDNLDDGGRMVYDPTNGTLSRGDLVLFPEGFSN